MEEASVSVVAYSAQPESQPTTGPSKSEPEPHAKKGRRNKMPTGLHVVEEVNANGVPVQPEAVYHKAKTTCGCLAMQAIRIIHDDWRKVPEDDKNYIWDNWSKLFKLPEGTRDLVKSWVLKTANKSFKDWKSDLNLDYVPKGRSPFEKGADLEKRSRKETDRLAQQYQFDASARVANTTQWDSCLW